MSMQLQQLQRLPELKPEQRQKVTLRRLAQHIELKHKVRRALDNDEKLRHKMSLAEQAIRGSTPRVGSKWASATDDKPFHGYNPKVHARTGGLSAKGREKFKREEGANLKPPVTEDNPTGERAKRRKSFCARMSGVPGPTSKDGKLTRKGAALKRWRC